MNLSIFPKFLIKTELTKDFYKILAIPFMEKSTSYSIYDIRPAIRDVMDILVYELQNNPEILDTFVQNQKDINKILPKNFTYKTDLDLEVITFSSDIRSIMRSIENRELDVDIIPNIDLLTPIKHDPDITFRKTLNHFPVQWVIDNFTIANKVEIELIEEELDYKNLLSEDPNEVKNRVNCLRKINNVTKNEGYYTIVSSIGHYCEDCDIRGRYPAPDQEYREYLDINSCTIQELMKYTLKQYITLNNVRPIPNYVTLFELDLRNELLKYL